MFYHKEKKKNRIVIISLESLAVQKLPGTASFMPFNFPYFLIITACKLLYVVLS